MSSPPRPMAPDVIVSSPVSPVANKKTLAGHGLGVGVGVADSEAQVEGIPLGDLQQHSNSNRVNNELSKNSMEEEEDVAALRERREKKGKGRAAVESSSGSAADDLENYEDAQEGFEDDEEVANGSYPPVADDEMEERRVNETLKRWEEQERQRRRALRDSNRSSVSKTSLVGDVSRHASKLWQDSTQRRTSLRRGATRIRDNSFEEPSRRSSATNQSHSNSLAPLPSRNSTGRSASPSSPTPLVANNPFNTPRVGSPVSLLEEGERSKSPIGGDVFMEESEGPPTPFPDTPGSEREFPDRPILQASNSYSLDTLPSNQNEKDAKSRPRNSLPPPQPLGLPQEVQARKSNEMKRTPSPMIVERSEDQVVDDDEIETTEREQGRWWTDWLCGCREGRREEQAGRTNPFE